MQKRSLYVHIPFCLRKCHYCDFVITTKRDVATYARFLDCLEKEVMQARKVYGPLKFSTIYFGGGTPSLLRVEDFLRIQSLLFDAFEFELEPEWTMEMNPGDLDIERLQVFREAGVSRASLGVQTFNQESLKDMNRPHGTPEIEEAFEFLRKTGFENISADLMIRTPGQSPESAKEDLEKLLRFNPEHISIYDLEVHSKTAWGRRTELLLPDDVLHRKIFDFVRARLKARGYLHYELLNYSKPGFESKHNLNYWENGEYLGLGPGAFSYLNQRRFQFASDVRRYFDKCEAGRWEADETDQLTKKQVEMETLLVGLRRAEGVFLDQFVESKPLFEKHAKIFVQEGWLETERGMLRLTDEGFAHGETVLESFAGMQL